VSKTSTFLDGGQDGLGRQQQPQREEKSLKISLFLHHIPIIQLVTLPITNWGAAGRREDVFPPTSHGQINPPRPENPGVN